MADWMSWYTVAPTGIGTSSARAASSPRSKSLRSSPVVNVGVQSRLTRSPLRLRTQVEVARGADDGGVEHRVGGDPLGGAPRRVAEAPERLTDRRGLRRGQFRGARRGLLGASRLQPQPQLHEVAP